MSNYYGTYTSVKEAKKAIKCLEFLGFESIDVRIGGSWWVYNEPEDDVYSASSTRIIGFAPRGEVVIAPGDYGEELRLKPSSEHPDIELFRFGSDSYIIIEARQ